MINIIDFKKDLKIGNYGEYFCDYSGHTYICDAITEIADNHTSIYYYDIKKFICNNFEALEEALNQFGWEGCGSDIWRAGRMAEFLQIEQEIYEDLDEAIFNYCLNYILNELQIEAITEEQLEALQDKCNDIDHNDTLEDFEDFVKELLEISEEEEDDEEEGVKNNVYLN